MFIEFSWNIEHGTGHAISTGKGDEDYAILGILQGNAKWGAYHRGNNAVGKVDLRVEERSYLIVLCRRTQGNKINRRERKWYTR